VSFVPDRGLVDLVPVDPSHVDHIMGWVNDREIVGNLATFAGKPLTRDDELAYIERMRASRDDRVFSVFSPSPTARATSTTPRYLGQVGLHQIFRRSGVGRLSIIVADRSEMGRGIGSAAIARLLDIAFAPPERGGESLHKVWLMCFSTNTRARRTYERVGFVQEGVLRDEYFHDDRWHDMVRYSVLAPEWSTGPGTAASAT
jgi:RimJ/RimL family protein N-acetyltransferase